MTKIVYFLKNILFIYLCGCAAKLLQSCVTLCDPIGGSPPGSPILGFSRQEHWSGLPFPSPMHESEKWKGSRSVVSDSSRLHGPQPTRLLCPWDFPGKSTGVGCHLLLRLGISSVQSLSGVWLFAIPWIAARQASLFITISWSSLRLMSIKSVMPSSHLILGCPFLLLPPIPPNIRVFSKESTLRMRWPKCWSFSFSIIPSKEIPGLISFRMDWLDLLAVQGTLKSLLQHHSSKPSVLQHSGLFSVQLSHPYMTPGKTIVLTRWTFVGKVMSVLFNMLSRLVITFLPRSKHLLISWLQSPSVVILESKKLKSLTVHCFPIYYLPWSDGTRCHDLCFLNVEL